MITYTIGQTVELVETFKNRYPDPRTSVILAIVLQEDKRLLNLKALLDFVTLMR